jgi:filamentous hemagglutinin family protein
MLLANFLKILKKRISYWHPKIAFMLAAVCLLTILNKRALGQLGITPDNSLGDESSEVTVDQNTPNLEHIEGGAKRGGNLFHSFSEFNVPSSTIVDFVNSSEINNIFSRVTGSDPSDILGQIRVSGNADLFLLNPNGIIFGSNASLDIGGSFIATTADSFNFADGTSFSATTTNDQPLLTVSIPVGLQFGSNVESIEVRGSNLEVLPEKTLALVGGEILLTGESKDLYEFNLISPEGRIEIGSVYANSKVALEQLNGKWQTDYSQVNAFKNIELRNGAGIDASGEGGGSIQLHGYEITLSQNSRIFADTKGSENGEEILIRGAKSVILEDSSRIAAEVFNLDSGIEPVSGTGGNIKIETEGLTIKGDNSSISTSTFAEGDGGDISITASKFLNFNGSQNNLRNGLFSVAVNTGNAGNIKINTNDLNILNGGQIFVGNERGSQGNGGNLTINAVDSVKMIGRSPNGEFPSGLFTQAEGSGDAGDLEIVTKQLEISNGAGISTSTYGQGISGDILIEARESIDILGIGLNNSPSALSARTSRDNNGGNITIETSAFRVADGAIVDNRTNGTGNGGSIFINANTFEAVNGGQVLAGTFENSSGNGGNIKINTTDGLIISGKTDAVRRIRLGVDLQGEDIFDNKQSGKSGLFVSSEGIGEPGNIQVQADTLEIDNQGIISAETQSGQGGNIFLQSQDFLKLSNGSRITTTAFADGDGGSIFINTDTLEALNNSDITANARQGNGGLVVINAQDIFRTAQSDITASSELDPQFNGIVRINVLEILPNIKLPQEPVRGEVVQSCQTTGSQDQDVFTVTGSGGLPPNPSESLRSSAIDTDSTTSQSNQNTTQSQKIVEAQGWIVNKRGNVVLTANANTAANFLPSASGCSLP